MKRKKFFLGIFCSVLSVIASNAQPLSKQNMVHLKQYEDTLLEYSKYIQTDSLTEDRMVSDSIFIKTLVSALRVKNSFFFPFDKILGISKLYAPDSSFRIFTWNIQYNNYYCRQRGAIQMKTQDGSLKLFPLIDCSEFTENPMDSIRTNFNWIGSIYYNIIKTEYQGKNYYTLFGLDLYSLVSNKKWMEVLTFSPKGEPIFGGPFFSYAQDTIPLADQFRYCIEYKKRAPVMMNFVEEQNRIIVDHLISENNQPEKRWTYIPDGDSEGFVWKKGKWVHQEKVFTNVLQEGQAPRSIPILKDK